MTTTQRDGTRPNPPLLGSLAYLAMNLPIGIGTFVFVVTSMSIGVSTLIIWVGLAVLAVAMLVMRGLATLERLRVHALLGTYIASPYRPAPERGRWTSRVKDPATWKDMAYLVLMLPIGIAEFVITLVLWSGSLYLALLPLYWPWLPADWHGVLWDHTFVAPDSWVGTLPFAGLGVLFLALAIVVTNALGTAHAVYARTLLGPSQRRISKLEGLSTAGAIDWSDPWPPNTAPMSYGPVSR
ncbi:sensor domain-containing protein [Actinophytocola sp.]|uniref:sensor domain-containing protein n=1 Tax=Actinophytocola sp. TaxID=1872138 RepID=UPI002D50CCC4|nr:sensor domain-containing protein [Actinophytocola sp.]HYQ64145.1 sensor domain-containing protein [Actinophytocola sp.]